MSNPPQDAATMAKPTKRTRNTTRTVVYNKRFDSLSDAWHQECIDRRKTSLPQILFQDFVDEILAAGLASRLPIVTPDAS